MQAVRKKSSILSGQNQILFKGLNGNEAPKRKNIRVLPNAMYEMLWELQHQERIYH
jgi:hypothetical protein